MSTELDTLVREYTALSERIESLDAERSQIKAKMRTLAVIDTKHPSVELETSMGLTVTVAANRRLDAKAVAQRYPVTRYPMFYKAVPDSAALKATLSPAEYTELMSIVGEAKVTVR